MPNHRKLPPQAATKQQQSAHILRNRSRDVDVVNVGPNGMTPAVADRVALAVATTLRQLLRRRKPDE